MYASIATNTSFTSRINTMFLNEVNHHFKITIGCSIMYGTLFPCRLNYKLGDCEDSDPLLNRPSILCGSHSGIVCIMSICLMVYAAWNQIKTGPDGYVVSA